MSNLKNVEVNEDEATVRYSPTNPRPIDVASVQQQLELLPDPSVDPIRPFRWRDPAKERRAQAQRTGITSRNYAQTTIDGRRIPNHRLVWILAHGSDVAPGLMLDHINRDHLDNRIENLREVTSAENGRNAQRRGVRNGDVTTSKYRGVSLYKRLGCWQAWITLNGVSTSLGYYETERLAAYIHDAVKLCLLLQAGGHGLPVLGVNACDPDSDIAVRDIWSFIGRARHEYGIDLDKILDRVARRSGLH